MQPSPTFAPIDLDSMPTMALTCDLLDRWGAERVSRHFGLSVEQLLTLARDLEGMPGSRAFAVDLLAAADELDRLEQ
ncbi:MAG: hypothetical protein QOC62_1603 [Mycobacterium sp.]|jgi:hypothetical protein|nr:hypothetical protein [Mycobacterium sp.]